MNMPPHTKLFSKEQIQNRIKRIAIEINSNYWDTELIMICVLKGATPFFSDLLKYINVLVRVEYISASSYKGGKKSSGDVEIDYNFETVLRGKHVLIVEDIIDSGLTLYKIFNKINNMDPLTLEVCSLLYKQKKKKHDIYIDYVGFAVPKSDFVFGYGMDYKGLYRNLPYIAKLKSK